MTLTPADHRAIAKELAQELAAIVLPILFGQTPAAVIDDPASEIERTKRQALALAKEGKKQESIALLKNLSIRRPSHA